MPPSSCRKTRLSSSKVMIDRHHLLVQSHIKPSSLQEEQPLVHLSSAAAGPHDRSWVSTGLPGRPHATKQLQQEDQVVQKQVALRMDGSPPQASCTQAGSTAPAQQEALSPVQQVALMLLAALVRAGSSSTSAGSTPPAGRQHQNKISIMVAHQAVHGSSQCSCSHAGPSAACRLLSLCSQPCSLVQQTPRAAGSPWPAQADHLAQQDAHPPPCPWPALSSLSSRPPARQAALHVASHAPAHQQAASQAPPASLSCPSILQPACCPPAAPCSPYWPAPLCSARKTTRQTAAKPLLATPRALDTAPLTTRPPHAASPLPKATPPQNTAKVPQTQPNHPKTTLPRPPGSPPVAPARHAAPRHNASPRQPHLARQGT